MQGLSKTTLLRGLREEQLREGLESLCGVVADIRLDALEIAAIVNFKDSSAARGCLAKQMTFPGVNLTFVRTNHMLFHTLHPLARHPTLTLTPTTNLILR